MPYFTRKRLIQLSERSLILAVDLNDEKTWSLSGHYPLYRGDTQVIQGIAIRVMDENGRVREEINNSYDFIIKQLQASYTVDLKVSEKRVLILPQELVNGYALTKGEVIELILTKVIRGSKVEKIYPEIPRFMGPIDVETVLKTDNKKEIIISGCKPYDTFRIIEDILLLAKKRVYIIDPHVDETVFQLYLEDLKDNVEIKILSKNLYGKFKLVARKFKKQRMNFEVRILDEIHDRNILVDNRAWIFGQSLKDAGNKTMSIIELTKPNALEKVFNDLWNRSKKIY